MGAATAALFDVGDTPAKAKKPSKPKKPKINHWKLWVDLHLERGIPAPPALGPDVRAGKSLAKALGDEATLKAVMGLYLADREPFVARPGHPLRMLGARVQGYLLALRSQGEEGGKYAEIDQADKIA